MEGSRSGVGRHERMKRGRGMKGQDERSRGIPTHIADAFVMIKPTTPFRLSKHEDLRKRNWSDSSDNSLPKADVSRSERKKNNLIKSSYRRPVVSTVRGMKSIGSGRFK
jgi:hypothetical protein